MAKNTPHKRQDESEGRELCDCEKKKKKRRKTFAGDERTAGPVPLDTIRTLTQQIKLKNLVLDSYIPPDELQKLTQHAVYDEREEIWQGGGAPSSSSSSSFTRFHRHTRRASLSLST